MHWTGPWTNQLLAAYPLYSFSKMFWGLLIYVKFEEKPVSAVLSDIEAIGEGQFDIYTAKARQSWFTVYRQGFS